MKKIILLSALTITFFSCTNSAEKKQNDEVMPVDTSKGVSAMVHDSLSSDSTAIAYICPCGGCPEVKESKAGSCPKCQMELVQEKK